MLKRIGTIGHVAHGKSTVVKAISGVQVNINIQTTSLDEIECGLSKNQRD